jgi:tetratricopeptide (TPR) repeat protein
MLAAFAAALTASSLAPARAQDTDLSPEMLCFRYSQNFERSLRIPQGLLTAITLAETGRPNADTGQTTAWPWTINVNGQGQFFDTKEEAVAATRKLLDSGQRSIDVGCAQVNLRYHPTAFQTIEDAFDPMNNMGYAARFLLSLHDLQGSWSQAVERYHSADDGRREQYREKVMGLWNREARNVVMNSVMAEDTDTPYHHAVRDFAAGRYNEALDKYQSIVDRNANDRIGLLGIAMSYEELGRDAEAMEAYARYLASEPTNETVLTRVIQKASAKAPEAARADLEAVRAAGVAQPSLLSALAEFASTMGDSETAFKYAADAAQSAPGVAAYQLNAGVLADRLNRTAAAVQHYERFLALFTRQPTFVDTPLDGIRERIKYLRARL